MPRIDRYMNGQMVAGSANQGIQALIKRCRAGRGVDGSRGYQLRLAQLLVSQAVMKRIAGRNVANCSVGSCSVASCSVANRQQRQVQGIQFVRHCQAIGSGQLHTAMQRAQVKRGINQDRSHGGSLTAASALASRALQRGHPGTERASKRHPSRRQKIHAISAHVATTRPATCGPPATLSITTLKPPIGRRHLGLGTHQAHQSTHSTSTQSTTCLGN